MRKIIIAFDSPAPTKMRIREIPAGQIFRGRIAVHPEKLFRKMADGTNNGVVFALDGDGTGVWTSDTYVDDYEPLKAEIQ